MNFFKKLFGGKAGNVPKPETEFSEAQWEKDYEEKKEGLELLLGPMHDLVGHAIIPFEIGGAVDMYYFTNHIPGTGFATMELLDPDGNGPVPNRLGTYELLAFTKEPFHEGDDQDTAFNKIERRFCGIFTTVGNYSFEATLNPLETCEVPDDEEENRCLVFDNYQPGDQKFIIGNRQHHLLLCMEVFRTEMEFARKNGTGELLKRFKDAGIYPYSDLSRQPVV